MRKTLLIISMFVMAFTTLNAQKKKTEKVAPVDNSYQVVNVNAEASVCFDTLTKRYDMVCFVHQGGQTKTIQIVLGTEFPEVARSIMASVDKYGVNRRTADYVLKYFILYRDMPIPSPAFTLDYCTDYALKLNLADGDYDISLVPLTFAITNPNADVKLKQMVPFTTGRVLTKSDLEIIRKMIDNKTLKSDAETECFMRVAFPELMEQDENAPAKGKGAKAGKKKDKGNDKSAKAGDGKDKVGDKSAKAGNGKVNGGDKDAKAGDVKIKGEDVNANIGDSRTKTEGRVQHEKKEGTDNKPGHKEDDGGKMVDDDQWKLY